MSTTRIASFDPASYKNLGWSLAELTEKKDNSLEVEIRAGTYVMDDATKEEPWKSLFPMFVIVDKLLSESQPDVVVIEKTSSFAGGFITGQVSNCIGVILACCGRYNLDVEFVYPTHVKKVVTGKGKATKTEIKNSVKAKMKSIGCSESKFDSGHAYDAVSNILCWMIENPEIDIPL